MKKYGILVELEGKKLEKIMSSSALKTSIVETARLLNPDIEDFAMTYSFQQAVFFPLTGVENGEFPYEKRIQTTFFWVEQGLSSINSKSCRGYVTVSLF